MALIKCPECGNMVSDMANACIHCGYPISKSEPEEGKKYCIILMETRNSKSQIMRYLAENYEMTFSDAVQIFNNLPFMIFKDATFEEAKSICNDINSLGGITRMEEYDTVKYSNVTRVYTEELRCPHCGSTQVSIGKRGFTLTLGLIGSGKTMNRCGNCGYTWKP